MLGFRSINIDIPVLMHFEMLDGSARHKSATWGGSLLDGFFSKALSMASFAIFGESVPCKPPGPVRDFRPELKIVTF